MNDRMLPPMAVVMTAFNAEATVERSVASALGQHYPSSFRVVVVNDGSTDGTGAALARIDDRRLIVIDAPRLGRSRALNRALIAADGAELIANLDADDYMLPGRLSAQARYLASNPGVGVVGSAFWEIHIDSTAPEPKYFHVKPPTDPDDFRRQMAVGFPICHSCATYRRELALELGGFDHRRRARIDFDLWLRMAIAGFDVVNSEETLGIHVKHQGTYFDRQFSRFRSAAQMARLNFAAARNLDLGARGHGLAAARLAYSLQRRRSVKTVPRYGVGAVPPAEVLELAFGAVKV